MASRRGLLPIAAIPGLSTFILFFALPAMLFRFGAATPLAHLLDLHLIVLYSVCGALVAVFPNSGFMGIPLTLALLGEAAVGVVIMTITVDSFLISSICLSMEQMQVSPVSPAIGDRCYGPSPAR